MKLFIPGNVAGKLPIGNQADIATGSIMGRNTAGTGAVEALPVATVKTMLGLSGTNTGDQTNIPGNAATVTGLAVTSSKTLTVQKTITLTSAGDSGVLTLPNATDTLAGLGTNQTWTGVQTFGNTVRAAGSQQLLTVPGTDGQVTGNTTNSLAAGYSSTAFDLVYLGSASKWLAADADAASSASGLLGIALEAKSDTQAMLVALPGSFVRHDAWTWTPGQMLYVSETAGGIATTIPTGADNVIRVIGWAVDADTIWFQPSPDHQVTVA